MEPEENIDFRNLTLNQQNELDEFEDFLRLYAMSMKEVQKILKAKIEEEFFILGLSDSVDVLGLCQNNPNAISWKNGYSKMCEDEEFDKVTMDTSISDTVELYIHWLISRGKNVVLVIPENFFTYVSKNKDEKSKDAAIATIREFEHIVKNLSEVDLDKLTIVG